jgi:hypothetical protein
MHFLAGLILGTFGGGFLSYLYAQKVIADYHEAAGFVGIGFKKTGSKVVAVFDAIKKL